MAEYIDDSFRQIIRDIVRDINDFSQQDREAVAGWLHEGGEETQRNDGQRARSGYDRYLRYVVQSEPDLPDGSSRPVCTRDAHWHEDASGPCPRKDVIAQIAASTDMEGIREIVEHVAEGEITTAAEFIFSIATYVKDKSAAFREVLETDLHAFREMIDDIIDRRIQDEGDVMMHTQNDLKQRFRTLTQAMIDRTMRIKERLREISPTFDWENDGKDRSRLSKLITVKRKEMARDPRILERLEQQVFMRGQWLKQELIRLQDENANLRVYLDKFNVLAAERKAQESHVPRMLCQEKKNLEKELYHLRETYRRNQEIIDALYVESHRCVKPHKEN